MHTLRKILPKVNLDEPLDPDVFERLVVTGEDFESALRTIEPSALREVLMEIPNVKWEDVGGLEEAKERLREAVEWPITDPDTFAFHGVSPPRGILLFGPPGCGKTLLAKAVASETEANFIAIRGPEVLSKWVGESERAVREVFRKAKQAAPSIVFLDEIDSIAPRRGMYEGGSHVTETVVNQLLTLLDGIESLKGVVVIAATNRPDLVDSALLRAGRLDHLILVDAPDAKARESILKVHTRNMRLDTGIDLSALSDRLDGFVGADIDNLCREAVLVALRRDFKAKIVSQKDFEEALNIVHPSVTEDVRNAYKEMQKRLLGKINLKEGKDHVKDHVYG